MKKVKELFNRKLILSIISMFVIAGLSFVYISNTNKELKKSEVYDLEVEEKKTNNLEIEEAIKYITVDIKGEVKSPGVYKIEEGKRVVDAINASGGLTKKAVTKYINLSKVLKDEDVILSLSTKEYEKMISHKMIQLDFVIRSGHTFKRNAVYLKKARGRMLNYLIKNCIEDIEKIKEIVIDDYHFSEDDSNDDHWVFIKDEKMKYIKK